MYFRPFFLMLQNILMWKNQKLYHHRWFQDSAFWSIKYPAFQVRVVHLQSSKSTVHLRTWSLFLNSTTSDLLSLISFNTACNCQKHCFGPWNVNCAGLKPILSVWSGRLICLCIHARRLGTDSQRNAFLSYSDDWIKQPRTRINLYVWQ